MSDLQSLENTLLNILGPKPMSEAEIEREIDVGCLRAYDRETVKYVLNSLHERNRIRWVAFAGWVLGGRPR
jgi:hypothetical protein